MFYVYMCPFPLAYHVPTRVHSQLCAGEMFINDVPGKGTQTGDASAVGKDRCSWEFRVGPERLWVGLSAWISRLAWIGSELKLTPFSFRNPGVASSSMINYDYMAKHLFDCTD